MNQEDSKDIKFICVQLPEVLNSSSNVVKEKKRSIQQNIDFLQSLNRPPLLSEIAKLRAIKTSTIIGNKYKSSKHDLGLRVFSLYHSNYKKWIDNESSELLDLEIQFNDYKSPLINSWTIQNLITEIFLIEGFPLHSRIETEARYTHNAVQRVSCDFHAHSLLICLDEEIEPETIRALDLGDNDIFICLDSAISDQDKLRLSDKGMIKTI